MNKRGLIWGIQRQALLKDQMQQYTIINKKSDSYGDTRIGQQTVINDVNMHNRIQSMM